MDILRKCIWICLEECYRRFRRKQVGNAALFAPPIPGVPRRSGRHDGAGRLDADGPGRGAAELGPICCDVFAMDYNPASYSNDGSSANSTLLPGL